MDVGILGSALKIEAVCPSETLASTYEFTRRYDPHPEKKVKNCGISLIFPYFKRTVRIYASKFILFAIFSQSSEEECKGDAQDEERV